jgi:hypothetical protein
MAGDTDYTALAELNWKTGQLVMPALPSLWAGLFVTAPTNDAGAGTAVEASGTGYARMQIAGQLAASSAATTVITFGAVPSWVAVGMSVRDITTPANVPANTTVSSFTGTTVTCNNTVSGVGTDVIRFSAFLPPTASSGSEPSTVVANATTGSIITFAQSGGTGWGTQTAVGIFDALTSGNLINWDYLGNFVWREFTASLASPSVITCPAHGYSLGDVVVVSTKVGGALPTLSGGSFNPTLLVAATVATDTFTLTTSGATALNASTSGNGFIRKVAIQPIPQNNTMTIPAGSLTFTQA